MTRINLLPWREARRAQRQRELVAMLVTAALVAAGIVFLVQTEIANRIEYQQERNGYPVSYTHLDVYKRQGLALLGGVSWTGFDPSNNDSGGNIHVDL